MRLAIIGASSGQLPICLKAKEMGLETFCFAWPEGAVCKDVVDHFIPISIMEKELIVEKCRALHVKGVVSNASELTAEVVAFVSEQLGLNGTPYSVLAKLHDKFYIRTLSYSVKGLSNPCFYKYEGIDRGLYPCVVKPCIGSSKSGVSFAQNKDEFSQAVDYAYKSSKSDIIVEEFIMGKELSVESISFKGRHYIIQITDKESSFAPHFVELGHHQPANIPLSVKKIIGFIIPDLLNKIGYMNGASHIELKYFNNKIYLIEVNLRGGGDEISNKLVQMSSGIDYLRCMIEVALGIFKSPMKVSEPSCAGIYYLCKQTEDYLPFFEKAKDKEWYVEGEIYTKKLKYSQSNYDRNGYIIYKSNKRIKIHNK